MLNIREAKEEDVPILMNFVRELAVFEQAAGEVLNNEQQMRIDGFGTNPVFRAFVAEWNGESVGMAIYYIAYSTWKGRMLFLDDLYVQPEFRQRGIASALLDRVISIAKEESCKMVKWQVLDWNTGAISLYQKYRPVFHSDWVDCKLYLT